MTNEEKKAIKSLKEFAYTIHGILSVGEAKTLLQLLEQKDKRIDELKKALVDGDFKYRNKINKAIDKLKKHKHDLDYEPWSIYKVNGSILFDLVKILEE